MKYLNLMWIDSTVHQTLYHYTFKHLLNTGALAQKLRDTNVVLSLLFYYCYYHYY